MLFASTVLALGTLAAPPATQDPAHDRRPATELADPGSPSASELAHEIDRSLHWIRSRQDPESGGYGDGSALQTATVLTALARSPRSYRPDSGPFVSRALEHLASLQREDGAFPDGELQRPGIEATTATVVAALESLGATGEGSLYGRAVAYLGASRESFAAIHRPPAFDSVAAARVRANELLAQRSADGSWPDGFLKSGPDMLRTARALIELSAAHAKLEAAAPRTEARSEPAPLPPLSPASRREAVKSLALGGAYLAGAGEDGRWGAQGQQNAGITAMVLGALLAVPEPRGEELDRAIDAGLDWLVSLQNEDGSIHDGQLANYVTSASILALAKAGRPQDRDVIARARKFLQELQSDEGEGYDASHHYYGGMGYNGDERPDLSNLQMALEALSAAGVEKGDPTFTKALHFLERSQNRSESNDISLGEAGERIHSGDDGGGTYAPGDSKAGFLTLADGSRVPRSYGSMTYALLKGYLFAGLPREDPRVEAAWKWLREHYTLDVNPGLEAAGTPTAAYQGLYYYYSTMARALALYGETVVVDSAGVEHDWRAELCDRLAVLQRQDGSWVNDKSPRWWEGNPVLATAYAMLALESAGGASLEAEAGQ